MEKLAVSENEALSRVVRTLTLYWAPRVPLHSSLDRRVAFVSGTALL